jgi:hypothetical protein
MVSILHFLALQDVIFDHASHSLEVCEIVSRFHAEAGGAEVAPCHYFTSTKSLEKHLTYGLPIDAETLACRSFLLQMEVGENFQALTRLVSSCIRETYPLVYSPEFTQPSCSALTAVANKTLSGWSERLVGMNKYKLLGGGPSSIAAVCYPPILESIVDVGKKIDIALKKELARSIEEMDRFVRWYLISFQQRTLDDPEDFLDDPEDFFDAFDFFDFFDDAFRDEDFVDDLDDA